MDCVYYQAQVNAKECWFLVAVLRSFEHLAFDRTIDKEKSIFEFFVPENNESTFLELMSFFKQQGIVQHYDKLPNRLAMTNQSV